jgi:hypothetical protein
MDIWDGIGNWRCFGIQHPEKLTTMWFAVFLPVETTSIPGWDQRPGGTLPQAGYPESVGAFGARNVDVLLKQLQSIMLETGWWMLAVFSMFESDIHTSTHTHIHKYTFFLS